jgi:hypothetical protein
VKRPKITKNPSEGQGKDSAKSWKDKALSRRDENAFLQQRVKELTASRDKWKNKYETLKAEPATSVALGGEKARCHQYSTATVALTLELHKYGAMSLRSCRHSVGCMLVSLGLSERVPSHTTIRNWLCKGGLHRVESGQLVSGEYVVYVDESIVFGSEKILLILGIPVAKIPQDRAVIHSDMEVLFVGVNTEWKAEHIEVELKKIAQKKQIIYTVSDEGNNLRKAYKSLNYTHIEDCTHILANHLKRLYSTDADFEAFRKLIGDLRKRWNLSKANSQYMPPTMRGKMRFANIFPCVAWAQRQLAEWANLPELVREKLAFLKEKEAFITSLGCISKVFKTVCSTLKNEGFGVTQQASIATDLDQILASTATDIDQASATTADAKTATFIANCNDYLGNLDAKSKILNTTHLLASSDIIESFFGKFKTKINKNNRSGLTEFLFTIANFSQSFSLQETKKALETIKLKDLKLPKKRVNST